MTPPVVFFVPGRPAPQGSMVAAKGGRMFHQSSKHLRVWRKQVEQSAKKALAGWSGMPSDGRYPAIPIGPVTMTLRFQMAAPTRRRQTDLYARGGGFYDVDKMVRAVLDGLDGWLYEDDAQVGEVLARKVYVVGLALVPPESDMFAERRTEEGCWIEANRWQCPL